MALLDRRLGGTGVAAWSLGLSWSWCSERSGLFGVAAAAGTGAVVVVRGGVDGDLGFTALSGGARVETAEEHAVFDPFVDVAHHVEDAFVIPA